jgi:hypothetical protein
MSSLELVGFGETQSALLALRGIVPDLVNEAVHSAANDALQMANSLTPIGDRSYEYEDEVHPGWLLSRNQVIQEISSTFVRVYSLINDARYAEFVILGTSKMAAQDFFTPAFVYGRQQLEIKVAAVAAAL